jgi:hypothetical protein
MYLANYTVQPSQPSPFKSVKSKLRENSKNWQQSFIYAVKSDTTYYPHMSISLDSHSINFSIENTIFYESGKRPVLT